MDKRNTLSSIVWFAVAVFVFVSSVRLGIGSFGKPGPGFVAFWASLFFVFFTVLMLVMNFIEKKEAAPLRASWQGLYWGNVLIVLVAAVIYLLLLETLGYLLATFGLTLVLFGLGRMKVWVVAISAALSTIASYSIFHILLKVPLPRGLFSL